MGYSSHYIPSILGNIFYTIMYVNGALFEQCTTCATVCGTLSNTSISGPSLSHSCYFLTYKALGDLIHKWLLRTRLAVVPGLGLNNTAKNITLFPISKIPSLLGEVE